ncbi:MAG TPA: glycosyltransferase family 2 protein [Pseudohaliea sp.]|nr:glycosyltransferase family 2 protein [Pseudohaliea sp.]
MTAAIPVSAVVCTRNEAANIGPCLEALAPFDQVFVVDSHSTDGTADVARAAGATVVPFRWNGRYPKKKEWCLKSLPLRHDWVLYVDADEVVPPALAAEIAALMARGPRHAGYFVDARYVFLGRPLRFGARNRKLALLDRRRAGFPRCDDLGAPGAWEVEGHYQPVVAGPVGRLRRPMLHWDRKPLAAYFDRHNRYADWEAALRAGGGLAAVAATDTPRRRRLKAVFDALPCKGLAVFLHGYVLRLGILDGSAGFHFALARAFYYWQVGLRRRLAAAEAQAGVQKRRMPAHHLGTGLDGGDRDQGRAGQAEDLAPDAGLLGPAEGRFPV